MAKPTQADNSLPPHITIETQISDEDAALNAEVERVEKLARLMDSQFNIPGIPIALGLDTLIGLIPVIGDTIGLCIAGYIVLSAASFGVPAHILAKMLFNIWIDWLFGLVPIIGDIFDTGWKGNNRNAALLRAHFERTRQKNTTERNATANPYGTP